MRTIARGAADAGDAVPDVPPPATWAMAVRGSVRRSTTAGLVTRARLSLADATTFESRPPLTRVRCHSRFGEINTTSIANTRPTVTTIPTRPNPRGARRSHGCRRPTQRPARRPRTPRPSTARNWIATDATRSRYRVSAHSSFTSYDPAAGDFTEPYRRTRPKDAQPGSRGRVRDFSTRGVSHCGSALHPRRRHARLRTSIARCLMICLVRSLDCLLESVLRTNQEPSKKPAAAP